MAQVSENSLVNCKPVLTTSVVKQRVENQMTKSPMQVDRATHSNSCFDHHWYKMLPVSSNLRGHVCEKSTRIHLISGSLDLICSCEIARWAP